MIGDSVRLFEPSLFVVLMKRIHSCCCAHGFVTLTLDPILQFLPPFNLPLHDRLKQSQRLIIHHNICKYGNDFSLMIIKIMT